LSFKYYEAIEGFVASPQEENNDEESSHASIGNQDTFERQVYEENVDDMRIQASITSPLHESQSLICYTPFQDFVFYDASYGNLEKENLIEKPIFHKEHDNKEIENIDALLHVERHKWDISCCYLDGDPIYDIDDDGSKEKIIDFWSCGQPNTFRECETYFIVQEQPCHLTSKIDLQVHKGGFHDKITT
jgi:hypothetical protein